MRLQHMLTLFFAQQHVGLNKGMRAPDTSLFSVPLTGAARQHSNRELSRCMRGTSLAGVLREACI
jgi:hypothetical protein